eukprot:s1695_g6.t6
MFQRAMFDDRRDNTLTSRRNFSEPRESIGFSGWLQAMEPAKPLLHGNTWWLPIIFGCQSTCQPGSMWETLTERFRQKRRPSHHRPADGNFVPDGESISKDLARKFKKYGDIVDVWVSRQPPGFAFVTYDTYKDALKAIEGMDGVKFQGKNLNIQLSMGKGGGGGAQPAPKQRRSRSRRRSSSRRRSRSRRSRRRSSERRRRDRSRSRSGSPRRDRGSPSYGR